MAISSSVRRSAISSAICNLFLSSDTSICSSRERFLRVDIIHGEANASFMSASTSSATITCLPLKNTLSSIGNDCSSIALNLKLSNVPYIICACARTSSSDTCRGASFGSAEYSKPTLLPCSSAYITPTCLPNLPRNSAAWRACSCARAGVGVETITSNGFMPDFTSSARRASSCKSMSMAA